MIKKLIDFFTLKIKFELNTKAKKIFDYLNLIRFYFVDIIYVLYLYFLI